MLRGKYRKIYYLFNTIKKENDDGKTITHKIKFIDTCRFMESKLSDLAYNLSEVDNKDCKKCMERKKIRSEYEFIAMA